MLCRMYKIPCQGKGVLPSLKMSSNVIEFAATPLNESTKAHITLLNPRLNRLSSPVIRGAILPQGTKAFEFCIPDGVPLKISPHVGKVDLGEVREVQLFHNATVEIVEPFIRGTYTYKTKMPL